MQKQVMIGMSGGVDSSVAAALLLERGYKVIGVTLKMWEEGLDESNQNIDGSCCSLTAIEDAQRVAKQLNIPHYVLDFKETFKSSVVDYFIDEYTKGRTPNPCVACNKHIKFEALLQKAASMEVDYIATGHYAKIEFDPARKRHLLKKSKTSAKDQTYFLYNLTQEQLSRTLFPIGDYTKDQIREIAERLNLAVASKPDSQEICFIKNNNYIDFISKNSNYVPEPGDFVDKGGNFLGQHSGIINYTVGQRKGLGLSFGKPMYVIGLNAKENTVILGDDKDNYSSSLIATDINFIAFDNLDGPMQVKAKIRYAAKEAEATINPEGDGRVRVEFSVPQRAITPGQSVVFYKDDIVLGGGIIEKGN